MKVIFIHPDLGIGGAERLVIDAAIALKRKGHEATFITAHHDPNHCFNETVDGTLRITCVGDWLPRSTFGYMYAFWAYIRMIYIAIYFILFYDTDYEVAFVDQISVCIPFLRLRRKLKICFYCHFPDQLLTDRKHILKLIYRKVFDRLEELTTKMADSILVNSMFTAGIFKSTFKSISTVPIVLYPSFDSSKFGKPGSRLLLESNIDNKIVFLSLNRFERKKNVELLVKALEVLLENIDDTKKNIVMIIIAGGYDTRVQENIDYFDQLVLLAEELGVNDNIIFLKSPSDEQKISLLNIAECVVYTPEKEHFGIVPIEAMYMGTPVIAVNSGGPIETVGEKGFLREPTPEAFADAMKLFIDGYSLKKNMGYACHEHIVNNFSFATFSNRLELVMKALIAEEGDRKYN